MGSGYSIISVHIPGTPANASALARFSLRPSVGARRSARNFAEDQEVTWRGWQAGEAHRRSWSVKTLVFGDADSSRAQPNCSTRASAQGQRRRQELILGMFQCWLAKVQGPCSCDLTLTSPYGQRRLRTVPAGVRSR